MRFAVILGVFVWLLAIPVLAQPKDPNWPRGAWHKDMRYERTQGFTRKGWNGSGTKLPHQFNIVSAPYPVRYGTHSERFEIRPDDHDAMGGRTGGNRSELTQRPNRQNAKIGEDAWYGWSFYHENLAVVDHTYGWTPKLGQWKTDLEAPPVIELAPARDGRGRDGHYIGIALTDLSNGKSRSWLKANNFGVPCRLFHIGSTRNKWVDIVINTNFGDDENGYLRVWVNGKQKCDYRGQIVVTPVDRYRSYGFRNHGPIFKRGYWSGHKGFPSRWKQNHPNVPIPTFVVYYDEWRQGKSRAEVDIRMIERAGGPAVD